MAVDFKDYGRRMDKALDHLAEEFGAVRAGRANPKVLDRITVEYYGSETPLAGVATISSPDARTLVISPWDTKLLKDIAKAIQTSDLGINPQNDGRVIRLTFPQLTEERRKDLVKQVRKYAEDAKGAMEKGFSSRSAAMLKIIFHSERKIKGSSVPFPWRPGKRPPS